MSASYSIPSEGVQNLPKIILNSPPLDHFPKRCSNSTTPGRLREPTDEERNAELPLIQMEDIVHPDHHPDPFARHFPAEITSYIFAIYTEDFNSEFDRRGPMIQHTSGPLLLAAVSKSWREIALGTPHLWNTVNVFIPSTDNLPLKVELTKQWLDRSRHLPLYLSLIYRTSTDHAEPLIPLFKVLQTVASRWHKLVLEVSPKLYTTFLGEVTCAPTLDTLKLVHHWRHSRRSEEGEFHLPHTPSLKHLHTYAISHPKISIEWSNLTTFEPQWIHVDEFFEILRRVKRLTSFRFSGLLVNSLKYPLPTTPFTHPTLTELYLETGLDIYPSQLETLLDLAVFPSLEKLRYRSNYRIFFPNRALHSLFHHSHCPLTHFHLDGDLRNGTSDDLISILSDLPMLLHLKLENKYRGDWGLEPIMSDKLLQRLAPIPRFTEADHTGRLLPRLESLEFKGCKRFSWSCLANLVSTTASDSVPMLPTISEGQGSEISIRCISFIVYFQGEREFIDAHSVSRFKCARDAGISIVITDEGFPHPVDHDGHPIVYPFDLLP